MRIFLTILFLLPFITEAQTLQELWKTYDDYRVSSIENRRSKHSDIQGILSRLSDKFQITTVGKSVDGREIKLVSYGSGDVNVLLWSQMHGNEPTATMALMDIFNFFDRSDQYDDFRDKILRNTTIHVIPMLNPDGAEVFQRRNRYGIDINRDALRLQTPEGRTLKKVRDSLDADWGFNLHDQGIYNAVGNSSKPATISFLAPPFDFEKSDSPKRLDAMRVISRMNELAQSYIPGQVGQYPDDFEIRAFGDNIQKWGTRTILIESGGHHDDREKQFIRRVNYIMLLAAMESISDGSYSNYDPTEYRSLPFNNNGGLHELIIRKIKLEIDGTSVLLDIGFRYREWLLRWLSFSGCLSV